MTYFRIQTTVNQTNNKICYQNATFFVGSCFAENISEKFIYYKLKNLANPFGVMFNVFSIENTFLRILRKTPFEQADLFEHNQLWSSLEVHSRWSDTNPELLIEKLNQQLCLAHDFLKKATHIVISLGSSWVYKHKPTNKYVANCHKISQSEFNKELISVEETVDALNNIRKLLLDKIIIVTISPVRHYKDGFFENNVSKSHLFSAVYQLRNQFEYFPSYEIINDELRDYRFFSQDMIHPNQIAVDYVWDKFSESYLTSQAKNTAKEVDQIRKALAHKPINSESLEHQIFLKRTQQKIQQLGSIWEQQ
ncbi:MAG: GSCFA domain-containing protein [Bacteroidota bacterium]|nr:GSCFA domain-containing protein [Bacteroidota bacterium]